MSSNRSLVFSGLIAAIIAVALVSGAVYVGVLNTTTTAPAMQVSQGNGGNETVTATSSTQIVSSGPQASSPTVTQGSGQSGDLVVLMTDPPTVPSGVSAVFITFANLGVHLTGDGNQTGWRVFKSMGQIDLLSVVNYTQTVAEANISAGNFNAVAFNVTSATVTYESRNYTADLISKNHVLFLPIAGGVTVADGKTSAAVIDFTSTVLLLGNQSDPQFAFVPAAKAYTVPAQSLITLHLKVGDKDDIHAASWWIQILRGSKFEVNQVTLTSSKISMSITNSGNESLFFRLADISSVPSGQAGATEVSNVASMLSISEVFAIESNGTLAPVTQIGNGAADSVIDSGGYVIPPGASVIFNYTGSISLGIAQTSATLHPIQLVVPGRAYILTLIGNGAEAQARVIASS